ncbi:glutaredoxin domain-containing protein [Nonomuraea sp. 10N515B]|uniref:glutaredoxin domain-containing protein n=1 Tax=Nonomuraea sp. 10N515B TaxID=3457422 RepID=UPI003FCC864B
MTLAARRPRRTLRLDGLYWRPGCPCCTMLRWELRAGDNLDIEEVNIWADPQAAARVRQITGGDEIVPTVVVRRHAMVNPSAADVYAAAGVEPVTARDGRSRRPWAAGLGPALVVAATPVARRLNARPLPPAAAVAATVGHITLPQEDGILPGRRPRQCPDTRPA